MRRSTRSRAASNLPVAGLEYLLLALLGVTIVVSIQAVGIILVVAMLVTPAATAQLLVVRFGQMMAIAVGLAALSAVLGLYLSFYLNLASGASIVPRRDPDLRHRAGAVAEDRGLLGRRQGRPRRSKLSRRTAEGRPIWAALAGARAGDRDRGAATTARRAASGRVDSPAARPAARAR